MTKYRLLTHITRTCAWPLRTAIFPTSVYNRSWWNHRPSQDYIRLRRPQSLLKYHSRIYKAYNTSHVDQVSDKHSNACVIRQDCLSLIREVHIGGCLLRLAGKLDIAVVDTRCATEGRNTAKRPKPNYRPLGLCRDRGRQLKEPRMKRTLCKFACMYSWYACICVDVSDDWPFTF